MSTIDQCLLIANSNYHVGQQVAVYVGLEQAISNRRASRSSITMVVV
jgi:hypothetical protein